MNCIRLGTDNSITVREWPEDNRYEKIHPFLTDLIGNGCDTVEHVRPLRLYKMHGGPVQVVNPYEKNGMAGMLIDECGRLKDNKINIIASWLYGMDLHGTPIMGNVVFCGECFDEESGGLDFCGLEPEVEEVILNELRDVKGLVGVVRYPKGGAK